ncbi:MAG TPA: serine/threonine-protein kinase [Verrucomicrobiota bacterium]|nr:serine/threonine-protein kinase [Verrucomicrobiota bacterium]
MDRVVALKILPPGIGQEPAFAERFTREAKALAKLNHPGIVTLYEFGKADGLFFFLMEFVDGMSLRHLLEAERIPAREALAIVPQICDALQYAHDQGIIHRDIKPENILMDRQGRVKVADFGLAKLVGSDAEPLASGNTVAGSVSLTEAGKVMGTPSYMAPEQREHPAEVDHRADIYSLGVVFYQMLTGELPGKPIEVPSHKVQVDVRLDEVVLRALAREPERRYQQVSQVRTDVEGIAVDSAQKDSLPKTAPESHHATEKKAESPERGWRKLLRQTVPRAALVGVLQLCLLETILQAAVHRPESTGELWHMALWSGSLAAMVWAAWPLRRARLSVVAVSGGALALLVALLGLDAYYALRVRPNLGLYQEDDWVSQHPGSQWGWRQGRANALWSKPPVGPFAPAVEMVLPLDERHPVALLDLDTRRQQSLDALALHNEEIRLGARKEKFDLWVAVEKDTSMVFGLGLRAATVPVPKVVRPEDLTPQAAVNFWVLDRKPAKAVADLQVGKEMTGTYVFHTCEGGIGFLELGGRSDNPPAVKVRYTLVRRQSMPAPSALLATPTSSWGVASNGLQMSLSSIAESDLLATNRFEVRIRNVGDKDVQLNVGISMANGNVHLPQAISLILTDAQRQTRVLEFANKRFPGVAGRVDDLVVGLQAGATYTLPLSLEQFWCPATGEPQTNLTNGQYRLMAQFVGRGAEHVNGDMGGMGLMSFWRGTLQSNPLQFNMAVLPVDAARWDAAPDEVRLAIAPVQRQAEVRLDSRSRTNTFFFRTSEGGTGVMQLLPAPAGSDLSQVHVRYRLIPAYAKPTAPTK